MQREYSKEGRGKGEGGVDLTSNENRVIYCKHDTSRPWSLKTFGKERKGRRKGAGELWQSGALTIAVGGWAGREQREQCRAPLRVGPAGCGGLTST